MIRGKTRHQLFPPHEMSRRLTAMAKSQKRARSDLLLEMVEAYMNRRAANDADSIERKLARIIRAVDEGEPRSLPCQPQSATLGARLSDPCRDAAAPRCGRHRSGPEGL